MATRKQPQDRKRSLRDQLAQKRSRTTSETFPLGEAGEKAAKELEEAQQAVKLLEFYAAKDGSPESAKANLTAAKTRLTKVAKVYEANALTLTFRGLSPDEVDALRSEFTADDDDAKFDTKGYTCALAAAATLDSDMSAEEWMAELYESGHWSDGEVRKIRETATEAYSEAPAPGIPKD